MERLIRLSVGEDRIGSEVCVLEVAEREVYHSSHQPDFQIEAPANVMPVFLSSMIQSA